ncbi:MAG: hypothetical protein JWQ49_5058 [Edaphobacter sp.]|nr:hypothetical protein [Edaphobacter sp.]
MRNHRTRDISSNLDDISVRTPDVSHRAFSALENDACNRRGAGIGSLAVRTRTAICSLETSGRTRTLETPPLQRLVDNRETILRVGNRAPGDLFEMLQCGIKLAHRSVTPLDVGRVPTFN